jgi:hypothetical protein
MAPLQVKMSIRLKVAVSLTSNGSKVTPQLFKGGNLPTTAEK